MYSGKDHTFAVCAYKENPYLEQTIQSLKDQSVKSQIILSTSTPNEYLKEICKKHNIPMVVNPKPHLAGDDWNYAYSQAKTPLVTLAHQDDIYEKDFLKVTLEYINKRKKSDVIMAFTDYYELKQGKRVNTNKLLKIKRIINWPLSVPFFRKSRFIRRRTLSVGCAICCPAATYVKKNAGENIFDTTFKNSCDYMTWVTLANRKGSFLYIPKLMLGHRIYAESATTKNLEENIRKNEDFQIMCQFWPKPIARFINNLYAKSEKSNVV